MEPGNEINCTSIKAATVLKPAHADNNNHNDTLLTGKDVHRVVLFFLMGTKMQSPHGNTTNQLHLMSYMNLKVYSYIYLAFERA